MTELIYVAPALLARRMATQPELVRRVISPGATMSGLVPAISTDGGGLWKFDLDDVHLKTDNARRAWRAIAGLCDGGANKLIVPICDARHQPWPLVGGVPLRSYDPLPHSDDSFFSDGSGYAQPVIDAVTVGAVALRSTQITIDFNYGGPPVGGEHFSVDHPTVRHRLYRIVKVEESGANYLCTIRPPLREAVPTGTSLDFDLPKCVMQPDPANALDLMVGTARGPARVSPKFIEAFV